MNRALWATADSSNRSTFDHLEPEAAIRRVAERTFDHHESHPDFIRLVSIENTHRAEHLGKLDGLATLNNPAVTVLEEILRRGYETVYFAARSRHSTCTC